MNGQGIGPHKDGPLYHNVAAVLSLGGSAVIDFFHEKNEENRESLFLEGRSLLVFIGDAYDSVFHEIKDTTQDKIHKNIVNLHLLKGKRDEIKLLHFTETFQEGDSIPRGNSRLSLTMRTVVQVSGSTDFASRVTTPEEQQEMKRRAAFFYKSISEKN